MKTLSRRTLFFGLAPALAAAQQPAAGPELQWSWVAQSAGVQIPASAPGYDRYGVLVQVHSESPDTEAYLVTVAYLDDRGEARRQVKATIRQRDSQDTWTSEVFWLGGQVRLIWIEAVEMARGRSATLKAA